MSDTPMMRQYREIKESHPQELLFFRLGDFYEMFLDDAREASQILNLTLTARNGIPMCGIPYHAAKSYIKRLLEAGKKIAVCEQVSDPSSSRGLVDREVVQIITPGTVVDDDLLISESNNYILSIACLKQQVSYTYADLSTGEVAAGAVERDHNYENLRLELAKIHPSEILLQESVYFEDEQFRKAVDQDWTMISRYPDWYFSIEEAEELLKKHFGTVSLQQFGFSEHDPTLASTGVLFSYLLKTSGKALVHIGSIRKEQENGALLIDESSQRNLELIRNMRDYSEKYTLFSTIRHTRTAAGTRLLRKWILSPLNSLEQIRVRHRYVDYFYHTQEIHTKVRAGLNRVLDLERLCARLSLDKASPRDLLSAAATANAAAELSALAEPLQELALRHLSQEEIETVRSLSQLIGISINEDVIGPFSEGKVIKEGYDPRLDELRNIKEHSVEFLDSYAGQLAEETGISKLRIKYNKIIGYFIEVTKSQTGKVPSSFIRKQTLVNGERYTTDRLLELEQEISAAYSKAEELERMLYREITERAVEALPALLALGSLLAHIDCFQSFAYTALLYGYTKPVFVENGTLTIINGRHPVVEQSLPPGEFVPNSLEFSREKGRFALITGPNMSGKSTFLRQTALIVLLSHMGSYVPADSAAVSIHDRIFCRVGAADNLARGESTFLVEMNETAFILRSATTRSLIIMDEVGRGTSTQDGVAIAFAVMKRLIAMGGETLFATHYHELTSFEDQRVQQLYLEVLEVAGSIVFTNKIRPGNAPSSYGLHAAKLAGIPSGVLQSAEKYQKIHAAQERRDSAVLQRELDELFVQEEQPQASTCPPEYRQIIDELRSIDADTLSPRDALELLYQLSGRAADIC
jgi:DNA mismatch repair protein MutS